MNRLNAEFWEMALDGIHVLPLDNPTGEGMREYAQRALDLVQKQLEITVPNLLQDESRDEERLNTIRDNLQRSGWGVATLLDRYWHAIRDGDLVPDIQHNDSIIFLLQRLAAEHEELP